MNNDSPSSPKRAVLVLGMHRSGTSLVTRLLSLLGADLPSHLLPANEGNIPGYWESADIVRIHEELLHALGMAWDLPFSLPEDWSQREPVKRFRQQLLDVLQRDFAMSATFVLKDPRVSLLLPVWDELLSAFGAQPSFVLCIRNPLDVAASLQKRNRFSLEKSIILWAAYTLNAERFTRGRKRCFVEYERLLKESREEVPRLSHLLGDSDTLPSEQQAAIDQTISQEYCHQLSSVRDMVENRALPLWARELYIALQQAHTGDASTAEFDRLDSIIQDSTAAFAPLLAENHQATFRIWQLEEQIKQLCSSNKEQLERLSRDNQSRIDQALAEIAAQKRESRGLMQDLVSYRSSIGRLESELAAVRTLQKDQAAAPCDEKKTPIANDAPPSQPTDLSTINGHAPTPQENRASRRSSGRLSGMVQQLRRHSTRGFPMSSLRPLDLIARSGLFDEAFYRTQLGDLPVQNCVAHYLERGDSQGLNPHWLFSSAYYREMTRIPPGQNTLVHYLTNFNSSGRSPHPMFDARFYLQANADVAAAGVDPLIHFLQHGWKEGRSPNRLFDVSYYLAKYPDVAAASVNPVEHYITHGQFEGRNPCAIFQTEIYRRFCPDLLTMKIDPLSHYLWRGIAEGQSEFAFTECECS